MSMTVAIWAFGFLVWLVCTAFIWFVCSCLQFLLKRVGELRARVQSLEDWRTVISDERLARSRMGDADVLESPDVDDPPNDVVMAEFARQYARRRATIEVIESAISTATADLRARIGELEAELEWRRRGKEGFSLPHAD